MAPYVQEYDIKASPTTIWQRCFHDMTWERWDPDIIHLQFDDDDGLRNNNNSNDRSSLLTKGTSFQFVMKDNPSVPFIPVILTEVEENRLIEYEGKVLYGMMKFKARIEIQPITTVSNTDDSHNKNNNNDDRNEISRLKYSFNMFGILGSIINFLKPEPVINGVEEGLAKMKRLSEE